MQPLSRSSFAQSSFTSHSHPSREASSLTNVYGLKRTADLFLSSRAGTRVVAVADDAYKITLESIHDEVLVMLCTLTLRLFYSMQVKCPICLGIISNTRTFMECMHRFCAEVCTFCSIIVVT